MRALSKGRTSRRTLYYSACYNHAESHMAGKQGIKKALAHDILLRQNVTTWHTLCHIFAFGTRFV